jgi:hypothetical protein
LRIDCHQQHISGLSTPRSSANARGVLLFWPAATVKNSEMVLGMHAP